MSIRLVTFTSTIALIVASPAALARTDQVRGGPSASRVREVVRHAQRSRDVWATVNICNTRRHPHALGIRGQLPALGFPAGLYMSIQVDYWARSQRKYMPDSHAKHLLSLGTQSRGRHQAGYTWRFAPPAILRGTVTFEWRLGRKVIGRTTRLTVGGIKNVDDGDPKGYSSAACRIST